MKRKHDKAIGKADDGNTGMKLRSRSVTRPAAFDTASTSTSGGPSTPHSKRKYTDIKIAYHTTMIPMSEQEMQAYHVVFTVTEGITDDGRGIQVNGFRRYRFYSLNWKLQLVVYIRNDIEATTEPGEFNESDVPYIFVNIKRYGEFTPIIRVLFYCYSNFTNEQQLRELESRYDDGGENPFSTSVMTMREKHCRLLHVKISLSNKNYKKMDMERQTQTRWFSYRILRN